MTELHFAFASVALWPMTVDISLSFVDIPIHHTEFIRKDKQNACIAI